MSVARGLLILVGMAVVGVGIALSVTGTAATALTGAAVERLGNDYLLVATVGAAGVVLTLLVVSTRAVSGIDQLTPPDPEGIPLAPRIGDEFDRFVDSPVRVGTHLLSDEPDRVRDRLREAAIQTVMLGQDCTREEARRQVDRGTWTDDVEAAAYLGGPDVPGPTQSSRIKAALSGRRWTQRGAQRTARAVVELDERGTS